MYTREPVKPMIVVYAQSTQRCYVQNVRNITEKYCMQKKERKELQAMQKCVNFKYAWLVQETNGVSEKHTHAHTHACFVIHKI